MSVARTRTAITRLLAWAHVVLALVWTLPLHGYVAAGRVNIVQSIQQTAPLWAVGFAVTGLVLLWSSRSARVARLGHASGAVVLTAFGAASLLSAVLSRPIGSVWPGVAVFVLVGIHLVMQRAYVPANGGV